MVYKENFYVGFGDVNRDLKLSNTSMMKFFENIACMHGTSVGDGFKVSKGRWFITSYHVRIHKRPDYEERVRVKSWSSVMRGVAAAREFEIYDKDGDLSVTALSNWVRVNRDDLKLERITPDLDEMYGSEPKRSNFDSAWIGKIKESDHYDYEKEFYIDRNFIDPHNHMNNVNYMELANLVIPDKIYNQSESNEFMIMYRKSIVYGETIKCFYTEEDDSYMITLKSQDGSELRAIIKMFK